MNDERLQDEIDIRALLLTAEPHDIDVAVAAVRLIASRRCHRGRDLDTALSAYLRRR